MKARAIREGREQLYPVSSRRHAQAATARLRAVMHDGLNGGHLLELFTEGMAGTLVLSRQTVEDAERAIAVFKEEAARLDGREDPIFTRPPQKLVF